MDHRDDRRLVFPVSRGCSVHLCCSDNGEILCVSWRTVIYGDCRQPEEGQISSKLLGLYFGASIIQVGSRRAEGLPPPLQGLTTASQ